MGVAIGAALEQKHKNDIRPLTETEQKVRNWTIWGLLILLLLGVFALVGVMLLVAG